MSKRRCEAVQADGAPCRAWAVRGSEPARCGVHGGTSAQIGAPPGNRNALKHGFYAGRTGEVSPSEVSPSEVSLSEVLPEDGPPGEVSPSEVSPGEVSPGEWSIETVILDLCIKQAGLSRYIEVHSEDLSAEELARFLQIHGQNASRLGRLLRDRRALCGEGEGMSAAIARALEELHREVRMNKLQTPNSKLQAPMTHGPMTNDQ
ncbi:MAG: hypothetical protein PVI63_10695 [Anaerolineae bacterium]